jgi:hypothetical protein
LRERKGCFFIFEDFVLAPPPERRLNAVVGIETFEPSAKSLELVSLHTPPVKPED